MVRATHTDIITSYTKNFPFHHKTHNHMSGPYSEDDFLSNASRLDGLYNEYEQTVTLCNKTFTCVGNDTEGYTWLANAPSDVEGDRGCRTDSLMAGHMVGF